MQKPLTFVRRYWQHIQDCLTVRGLLRENSGEHLNNLYWYDLPIKKAVSLSGIMKVIWWGLKQPPADEIAGNYGLISLYRAEAPEQPIEVSNPPSGTAAV